MSAGAVEPGAGADPSTSAPSALAVSHGIPAGFDQNFG